MPVDNSSGRLARCVIVVLMLYTRAQILADGTTGDELRGLLRSGSRIRLARGVYVDSSDLDTWEEERYRLRVRATAIRSELAMTHVSAAALYGLPLPGADLSEVHMMQVRYGGNRHRARRHVHSGSLPGECLTTVDGVVATSVARTLVDVAKTQPRLTAVAAADSALHQELCTYEDIADALTSIRRHRGAPRARLAMVLADGRSESPGETWTRLALNEGALPDTELQIDVYDETGRLVGTADGGYPEFGLLWEYDGEAKYHRLLRPGQSTLDTILKEKNRENDFIELGYTMIRVVNEDRRHPADLRSRVRRALDATQRPGWLPPRGRWVVYDKTHRRQTPSERWQMGA